MLKKRGASEIATQMRATSYGSYDLQLDTQTQRSHLIVALALSALGTVLLTFATLSSAWSSLVNQHYMANNFRVDAGLFTVVLTSAEPTAGWLSCITTNLSNRTCRDQPFHFM
jgi:hypothetical protein